MSAVHWMWTLTKSIPSSLDAGHAAIEELIQALHRAQWGQRDVFRIHLAIEEAVVNAIEHGNKRCVEKLVHLDFRVAASEVMMQVTDEGAGFDPSCLPDPTAEENLSSPRGRGVMLVREFMSEATYNACGNSILMIKRRSSEDDEK